MEQDTTRSIKLFWIGILTFLSFILFFYGIKFLQNESFQQSTISFKVIFKNSQGIDSGDEVRMLGKKIGFVKGTNIIGQNIILDISVSNMFKNSIPIDSRFEITSEDIMGGKNLTIYPGKDTNKFILNGDTVSGKNSEVVSLTQDIGDFARTLNETFGLEQKSVASSELLLLTVVWALVVRSPICVRGSQHNFAFCYCKGIKCPKKPFLY